MRPFSVLALAWCLLPVLPAAAEQAFPYKAYIVADDVYVRSGPGTNYYPTAKLQSGEAVEVYRHDPGGWYVIRPPKGSFEWVSARYLSLGKDDIAEVTADGVAARVGSQFSDIRDVIQVRLHQGELVEVLDSADFSSGPDSGRWYKVAPPSGAFRWVHGKYVDASLPQAGIRKVPDGPHPLTEPEVSQQAVSAPAELPRGAEAEAAPIAASRAGSDSASRAVNHWAPVTGRPAGSDAAAQTAVADPNLYTNEFTERAADPNGSPTLRRISPEEFQAHLDKLNMDLSAMLVEEPTVWAFDELELRSQSLLGQAETAVERGRVRLVLNRIAQSRDIKDRYAAVNEMETEIKRHDRQLSAIERRRQEPPAARAAEARFDGVGRLRRVVSSTVGAPQYALVDEAGNVQCFLTPAPGVNVQYYLGRQIGVTGIRGFIPDRGAQHVTAKHVTPLEDRTVLR